MTAERLHIDFETRSACNLKSAGAYRYAIDKTTQVTHLGWRFSKETIQCWRPGLPFPRRVAEHIAAGGIVVCHNAGFERRIWNFSLSRQVPGLAEMRAEQQSCTLARALAMSYPDDLETLVVALGSPIAKDMEGNALMLRFSKGVLQPDGSCEYPTPTPEQAARITAYNIKDVEAESWVDDVLPELSERERQIWILDQCINDRGIPIDVDEVRAAQALAKVAQAGIDKELRALTKGHVHRVTEAAKVLEWLNGQGFPATAATEFDLSQLDFSSHPAAARVVELRTGGAKSSLAKFDKMLSCVTDGRTRDQYAYYKANTGRWAGRLVQYQNLKRLKGKDKKLAAVVLEALEIFGLDAKNAAAYIELVTGSPALDTLARSMRRFVKSPRGRKFYGADFSNIEGRFNAWVAGEDWKLDAFRAYDRGEGPDLYKVGASRLTGKAIEDIEDDGFERQALGKVPELAGGYGGGVGAFVTMGPVYGVKPIDLVPPVRGLTEPKIWADFAELYHSARDKHGLNLECWVAIKILVRNFRLQNARIAASWYNLHDAAVLAVQSPGYPIEVKDYKGVTYLCTDGLLWCKLPSGRMLVYASPSVVIENQDSLVWNDGLVEDASDYLPADIAQFIELGVAQLIERKPRPQVRFFGKAGGGWVPKRLYGGLQCENIVQAACRDIQASAMLNLEAAGYPIVSHTHDDVTCEISEDFGSEAEFAAIMGAPVPWAPGLPIAVKSWSGHRYGD